MVCGLVLQAEQHWVVAVLAGLAAGALAGAVNGLLIAYVGLPAFVVTLGMLSVARSLAIVLSENKMIYEFGPYGDTFNAIGGGSVFGIANPVWTLDLLALVFGFVFNFTAWGNYLYAIGSQRERGAAHRRAGAARSSCRPISCRASPRRSLRCMIVGWQGSAINALGQGYELRVIASTVIGGADLMGGAGRRLRRGGRRGPDRGDPQFPSDGRRRCQLAGRLRRPLHRVGGSAPADPRQTLGLRTRPGE